jgi:diaminohydroxyphosphoribosylaminopyrimidine deaminase/5-amino-6-(5-phosphoribosylamino)uracil reductase
VAVRHEQGRRLGPERVFFDTNAETSATAQVLNADAPALIAVAEDADASHLEGKADILR